LFVVQVFEGAITWSEIQELPVDEIEWLFKQAQDVNDNRQSELSKSKGSMRGRR
jgi:hypothetical protein